MGTGASDSRREGSWLLALMLVLGAALLAPTSVRADVRGPVTLDQARERAAALGERGSPRPPFARPSDGRNDVAGNGYASDARTRHRCFERRAGQKRSRTLCVHWATRGDDAPPGAKRKLPGQVKATIAALKHVWAVEVVQLGYEAPLPDGGRKQREGPNDGIDVYLSDIGASGFAGYCLNDDRVGRTGKQPASAYCVIDDDFSGRQFSPPGEVGVDALQTTVAHEFFHAIQFAYEFSAGDLWLDEGTAMWMQQLVYDPARNGEPQYPFLGDSALAQPETPLDAFGSSRDGQDNEYGAWIFWEFLTEYLGTPDVVRDVWRAVGRSDAPTASVLADVLSGLQPGAACRLQCSPGSFGDVFAEFATWTMAFPHAFADGGAYAAQLGLRAPPLDGVFSLEAASPDTGTRSIGVAPLSARSIGVVADPGRPVLLSVAAPDGGSGGAVVVQPYDGADPAGPPIRVPLDGSGSGSLVTPASALRVLFVSSAVDGDPRSFRFAAVQL